MPPKPVDPEIVAKLLDLSVKGFNETQIAKAISMDRKKVRRLLDEAERSQMLTRIEGGGKGRSKRYSYGPLYPPQPTIGGWSASSTPSEIEVEVRIHNNKFAMPVFEDDLLYRDVSGAQRRWTVGAWSDDFARPPWVASGVQMYEWLERGGRWRLVLWKHPQKVRAAGKKNRVADRIRIGTVVLMPTPKVLPASAVERGPEIAFQAALDLIRDIKENRRLELHGIPLASTDPEYGFPVEEHPSIPPGTTWLDPKVWIDRSPPAKGPEVETKDLRTAQRVALGLSALKSVPTMAEDLAALRSAVAALRGAVDEVLELLRRQG